MVFASLFERAEASVDNAIGDLGNRVIITIPFIVALGFGAASLSLFVNRTYGAEVGNLIVAGVFAVLGGIIALVVKARRTARTGYSAQSEAQKETAREAQPAMSKSFFDNEQLMGIASAAAPILLPALLRTATKNWPLVLAVAAGLYVFSMSDSGDKAAAPLAPQA
ncbi:hypothetical protein [Hyphomicrobium sp.]|uniref:hypothetical protein n=1 Tax=Hyphomicrobium sp. TaxID=82 RepID=UPI0025BED3F9|nr:hypothetical protein [Hyphomicrobium sp.]